VRELAKNKEDVESLDLTQMLERLDLRNSNMPPALPSYHELYPSHWANNPDVERKHLNLITKIKNWPTYEDNQVCECKEGTRNQVRKYFWLVINLFLAV
jgi:hypothetical protein